MEAEYVAVQQYTFTVQNKKKWEHWIAELYWEFKNYSLPSAPSAVLLKVASCHTLEKMKVTYGNGTESYTYI